MKSKILLLISTFVLGCFIAKASGNVTNCGEPTPGKKEDIGGSVHSDAKKPLKDVSITAYLSSKKEKVVITDGCGSFSFDDLKAGNYKLVFEKQGYKKVVRENVAVKVDEAFQLNIEMVQDNEHDLLPSPMHFIYN
jgi:hypothetical protein